MVKMEYLLRTRGTTRARKKIHKTISKMTRESRKTKANKETNPKRSTLTERVRYKKEKVENSQEIRKIFTIICHILSIPERKK